jgi:hypothetical protein
LGLRRVDAESVSHLHSVKVAPVRGSVKATRSGVSSAT